MRFEGSGGYRLLVAYLGKNAPAYLMAILSKGQQANFSPAQVAALHGKIKAIKQNQGELLMDWPALPTQGRSRWGSTMEDVTDDVFAGLMEGLDQIEAQARGETTTLRVHVPQELDVAAIRARSGVSQPAFAQSIGINVATLKQWEQGRRRPQGPARVLLAMIEREPHVVARVLAGTQPDAMAASDPPLRFGSAEGGAKPRTRKAGVRRAGAA